MKYGSQIWDQFLNSHIKRITNLQNKSIRIINFSHFRISANIYYKSTNILNLANIVKLNNFLFVHDPYHNKLPATLTNIFSYTKGIHSHNTRGSKQQHISLPKVNTQTYGINSIKYSYLANSGTTNSL